MMLARLDDIGSSEQNGAKREAAAAIFEDAGHWLGAETVMKYRWTTWELQGRIGQEGKSDGVGSDCVAESALREGNCAWAAISFLFTCSNRQTCLFIVVDS